MAACCDNHYKGWFHCTGSISGYAGRELEQLLSQGDSFASAPHTSTIKDGFYCMGDASAFGSGET